MKIKQLLCLVMLSVFVTHSTHAMENSTARKAAGTALVLGGLYGTGVGAWNFCKFTIGLGLGPQVLTNKEDRNAIKREYWTKAVAPLGIGLTSLVAGGLLIVDGFSSKQPK